MTDVGLDDLIKEERSKKQLLQRGRPQRGGRGGRFGSRPIHHPANRSNAQYPRQSNLNIRRGRPIDKRTHADNIKDNAREERDDNRSRPIKKKFISKDIPEDRAERTDDRTLKVMGLHPDYTNEDLYKLFATEGAMEKCLIEQDNFGRSLTTAVVKYHNASSAQNAIKNINQHKVMNSILTVEPYKFRKR